MFSNIFYFTTSRINPRSIGTSFLRIFLLIRSLFRPPLPIDLHRLSLALDFPRRDRHAGSFDKSIELVFVAIKKDFPVLVQSIFFAQKSIEDYRFAGVRVIVPDDQVEECTVLLADKGLERATVVSENTLITRESFKLLRETFEGRANWVLQQILKVQAVLVSTADATLIVDSDTLLLSKRPWFSNNGSQLLTPSYEFNASYYEFLACLDISHPNPKYTFISHHMLMQRSELEKTFFALDWKEVDSMVDYTCRNARTDLESPVCVEYELYAQSLLSRSPEKVHLGIWGNISISRSFLERVLTSKLILATLRRSFHSVSLHSWSTK